MRVLSHLQIVKDIKCFLSSTNVGYNDLYPMISKLRRETFQVILI